MYMSYNNIDNGILLGESGACDTIVKTLNNSLGNTATSASQLDQITHFCFGSIQVRKPKFIHTRVRSDFPPLFPSARPWSSEAPSMR